MALRAKTYTSELGIKVSRQLQNQVARTAEAGQTEYVAIFDRREFEGAKTNPARTQERRGFVVGEAFRYWICVVLPNRHELGIATVCIASRGDELIADVFIFVAGRLVYPADADTITDGERRNPRSGRHYNPDDLVPGNYRQKRWRRTALDLIDLGMANPASTDLDQNLTSRGFGTRNLSKRQRIRVVVQ